MIVEIKLTKEDSDNEIDIINVFKKLSQSYFPFLICNSLSWASFTSEGAPVIGQTAF